MFNRKSCEVPEDSNYRVVTIGLEAWSENTEVKKNLNISYVKHTFAPIPSSHIYRALVEIIKTPGSSDGSLISPARSSPNTLQYVTDPYRIIVRKGRGVQHFITYGSVTVSNVIQPAVTTNNKMVKSIAIEPLVAEWERGIAFYNTVCAQDYLGTRVWKNAVSFGTRFDNPQTTAGGKLH